MWNAPADDTTKNRARTYSLIAGVLREQFGAAWWIYIDGAAYGTHVEDSAAVHDTVGYSWLPGLFTTIAFVMINGMLWSDLSDTETNAAPRARAFLIFAMMLAMGGLAWSLFIMVDKFLDANVGYEWGGISVFLSNLLIFLATWLMRVGTLVHTQSSGW